MLSILKPTRDVSIHNEDSSPSYEQHVIPPGTPYLTKVNGKLVWARKKTPKPVSTVQNFSREAFGSRAVIMRRQSKSLERPVRKVIIGTVPIVRTQPVSYSAPIPQQAFPTTMPPLAQCPHPPPQCPPPQYPTQFLPQPMPQTLPQQSQPPRIYIPQQPLVPRPLFVQQSPTEEEKEQLKVFDAHFNKTVRPRTPRFTSASSEDSQEKQKDKPQEKVTDKITEKLTEATTTTVKISITKHVCGDCGRLRSRKYHQDHPLKPGEVPELAFCRKCQKDASSTGESSDAEEAEKVRRKKKKAKKAKKAKKDKEDKKDKKAEKTKKTKASRKKPVESSEDDDDSSDSSDFSESTPPRKPKPSQPKAARSKKSAAKKVPTEEYIIVEEEFSDYEQQSRGRSQSRTSREHEARKRPVSKLGSQTSTPRSRSRSYVRSSRHDNSENAPPPLEIREVFKEKVRLKSPKIQYRYVEVVPSHEGFERKEPSYPRKAPVHFGNKVVNEKRTSPKHDQQLDKARGRASYRQAYSVDEPESIHRNDHADDRESEWATSNRGQTSSRHDTFEVRETSSRGPPSRDNGFEDPVTISPTRSSESRRRRKRERAAPGIPNVQSWEQPHVTHPESDDEVVVVTETFEYRMKKQAQDEEERRRQEYIDRATFNPRNNAQFSADEASKYYHQDWSRVVPEIPEIVLPSIVTKPYQPYQPAKPKTGYRRDMHPESESTDSVASYEYTESSQHTPPRAPTPPPPIYQTKTKDPPIVDENGWYEVTESELFPIYPSRVHDFSGIKHFDWGDEPQSPNDWSKLNDFSGAKHPELDDEPPYPLRSGSEPTNTRGNVVHMAAIELPRRRGGNSIARPAYVREATDGGTETALILSPGHSNERNGDKNTYDKYSETNLAARQHQNSSDEFSASNMTKLERQAEAEARHVRFRDTRSMRSVHDSSRAPETHGQSWRSEHHGGGDSYENNTGKRWGDW